MYGEDCLVQMLAEGTDGGRRFFKCPRAWAFNAPENCGFVRWVDPPPIHPHAEYIYYLHNRIFDLEMEVSSGNNEEEEDENKGPIPPKYPCTIPYCNCPCHNNNPPAPPPPHATGAYYGDGSTQFANWEQY
ncbi:hypothetical protein PVAP13_3NG179762 [Panicum virgatum]|uniref:GRF-type domain-containing protein n=1 Tax=Panicum virgatum TaxID=38727 RepID=A0A8T0TZE5_PANVG|nr:hypothetical protein PVAP13_3NG179762 [Panicum virgatum]